MYTHLRSSFCKLALFLVDDPFPGSFILYVSCIRNIKGATIYKHFEFKGTYLIQTLLVLYVIIFAVLGKDQLHDVLVKHLIPASPLRVGPNNPLILQITHSCSDLFIIQYEI